MLQYVHNIKGGYSSCLVDRKISTDVQDCAVALGSAVFLPLDILLDMLLLLNKFGDWYLDNPS